MSRLTAVTVSREEELYWLALHLVPGLGKRKASQLLGQFGTPQEIFRTPASELEATGLAGSVARSIARWPGRRVVESDTRGPQSATRFTSPGARN